MLVNPYIYGTGNNLVATLYNGSGASRSIVTGQNLAAGGIVTVQARNGGSALWFDTDRGANKRLASSTTDAELTLADSIGFLSNGVSVGTNSNVNSLGVDAVLWPFLVAEGFADVVTWTGNNSSPRTISHGVNATVGEIVIKSRNLVPSAPSGYEEWYVYHRSLGATKRLSLSSTAGEAVTTVFNDTNPTSSVFTVAGVLNATDVQYVALVFAHNAAKKIACGTLTTDSSGNATVTGLGFTPKLIDLKRTDAAGNWNRLDAARGWDKQLNLNTSGAETTVSYMAASSGSFTLTGYTTSATVVYKAVG